MKVYILGLESSCDDTAAAVFENEYELSNIVADQEVHKSYGGVVPELASRAHQQNIVPVVEVALQKAEIDRKDLHGIAFTRGPGLMGSLLVGTSFAKSLALALDVPLLATNHLQAHMLVHFIKKKTEERSEPLFPFLGLLVSGGHSQLMIVHDHLNMEIIGQTIDDAAGEAFDKSAKILGLPYPGGPMIDKYAREGNPNAFSFNRPDIAQLDYSFSGLKTSFLYFLRDQLKHDKHFIENHMADLCASLQQTIVEILIDKLEKAAHKTGINTIVVAGGVAANSGLRNALKQKEEQNKWHVFLPGIRYSMDNAAMTAITGYYQYLKGEYADQSVEPAPRFEI